MLDDQDYLYVCTKCGKLIEFGEYISNDNMCDECSQKEN